jgi:transposase-like protein
MSKTITQHIELPQERQIPKITKEKAMPEPIIQCTHCGSVSYRKNGKYKGSQRYLCNDCRRAFSDRVRKFTYADKERFLLMYFNNVGIRRAAVLMGCSSSLLVRWVREFAANLRRRLACANNVLDEKIPDIIEMDEIYTRIKKGAINYPYGLLILGSEVRLLHISSDTEKSALLNFTKK